MMFYSTEQSLLGELLISARTMRCFNQKIAGAWVGGGGGFPTNETCEATSLARGYPCYVEERPVVFCTGKYYNDYLFQKVSLVALIIELKRHFTLLFQSKAIKAGTGDPAKKLECNKKEGVKWTFFGFNKSEDKSIPGGHKAIKNV